MYCRSLCTVVYDVNNLIPVAIKETNNFANENNHAIEIIEQLNLKDDTIIIFDRKYYSKKFLKFLHERNIIPIFRMDIENNFVKKLKIDNTDELITSVEDIPFKIIKYIIKDSPEEYFIGTTKLEFSVDQIKELYWKRWNIEEFYKNLKHKMKGWFYNTSNKINYLSSIKAQHLGMFFLG